MEAEASTYPRTNIKSNSFEAYSKFRKRISRANALCGAACAQCMQQNRLNRFSQLRLCLHEHTQAVQRIRS